MTIFFDGVTANSTSAEFYHPGGRRDFIVSGVYDTAVVTLEMSFDNKTTWVVVLNDSFGVAINSTAPDIKSFELNICHLRVVVSSVGASTDLRIEAR